MPCSSDALRSKRDGKGRARARVRWSFPCHFLGGAKAGTMSGTFLGMQLRSGAHKCAFRPPYVVRTLHALAPPGLGNKIKGPVCRRRALESADAGQFYRRLPSPEWRGSWTPTGRGRMEFSWKAPYGTKEECSTEIHPNHVMTTFVYLCSILLN